MLADRGGYSTHDTTTIRVLQYQIDNFLSFSMQKISSFYLN